MGRSTDFLVLENIRFYKFFNFNSIRYNSIFKKWNLGQKKNASKQHFRSSTRIAKCLVLSIIRSSVVDPNTLNLDPDPGFWPNLDQDPGPDPKLSL